MTSLLVAGLVLASGVLAGRQATRVPSSPADAVAAHRWGGHLSMGNVFDSNIDHDETSADTYGVVLATGLTYRSSASSPAVEVTYEAAGHSYTNSTRWDRVSHAARAALDRRLTGWLRVQAVGEATVNGSSEDRELVDQYSAAPRIEFRLSSRERIRLFAVHRLKRYGEDPLRNAINQYVGIEFRQRGSGRAWEMMLRRETNRADAARYDFRRWTYSTRVDTPVGSRHILSLEVEYRSKRYPGRLVKIEGERLPRHNERWTPTIAWRHVLGSRGELSLTYSRDVQWSNDPDSEYAAHFTALTVAQRW